MTGGECRSALGQEPLLARGDYPINQMRLLPRHRRRYPRSPISHQVLYAQAPQGWRPSQQSELHLKAEAAGKQPRRDPVVASIRQVHYHGIRRGQGKSAAANI